MTARCLAVIVVVAAVSGHGDAQQPDPKFGAATTAVVIDVVVRDAKGRPVTDLTRADFELLEDGVAQTLGDVTRIGAHYADRVRDPSHDVCPVDCCVPDPDNVEEKEELLAKKAWLHQEVVQE